MYRLWLARLLTYEPATRKEGLRLLESIRDPGAVDQARAAWRQALLWEKDNPDVQASLEAYTRRYPDRELQNSLDEQHGFRALRERDLATAQARFEDVLRQTPNDTNALVGLGFVRMGLKKFDQALVSFNRARELAPDRADAKEGYDTARFWLAMQRGAGLQASQPDAALAAYEEAAALRPGKRTAADRHRPIDAAARESRGGAGEVRAGPESVAEQRRCARRAGIRAAEPESLRRRGSLFARAQTLDPKRPEIEEGARTARFWGVMQQGADGPRAESERRGDRALQGSARDRRWREGCASWASPKRTRRKGNRAEALDAYRQLATTDPNDPRGWLGLVRIAIESDDPRSALDTVQSIPQSTRSQLDAHPDILARLAQALYATNQPADGDRVLRTALDVASRSDSDEALDARLELASVLVTRAKTRARSRSTRMPRARIRTTRRHGKG